MVVRPLLSGLLLLSGAAVAQPAADGAAGRRIDVLTGEPVRPRGAPSRPQPVITNAPHAPRQAAPGADGPPMEILVAPQVGTGQVGTGQVGVGQMGMGQMGVGPMGLGNPGLGAAPLRPLPRRY